MAKAKPTSAAISDAEPAYAGAHETKEVGKAVVTHILGLLTLFVGPLVMYFLFRRTASPWLRDHLDEAVNYHILVVVAAIALTGLALLFTNFGLAAIALVCLGLLVLVVAANLVFSLAAIIQAARGRSFHFPLDIKMVK